MNDHLELNLTEEKPSLTFQRLIQTDGENNYFNGLGEAINLASEIANDVLDEQVNHEKYDGNNDTSKSTTNNRQTKVNKTVNVVLDEQVNHGELNIETRLDDFRLKPDDIYIKETISPKRTKSTSLSVPKMEKSSDKNVNSVINETRTIDKNNSNHRCRSYEDYTSRIG